MCKFRGLWARRPGEAAVHRSQGPSVAEGPLPLLPAHLSSEDQPHQPLPGGQAYAFVFKTFLKKLGTGTSRQGLALEQVGAGAGTAVAGALGL